MSIQPVVCTVDVDADLSQAFDLFMGHMGTWWKGGTIGAKRHVAIVVEPKSGGRWYERDGDGKETQWGNVLTWDPPRRAVLGWQLNSSFQFDPNVLTEVEVVFSPQDSGGTRVKLEHRNLERYGADAGRVAGQVGSGWQERLADFARASSSAREEAA